MSMRHYIFERGEPNSPATDIEIANAERRLGCSLPPRIRDLYELTDGLDISPKHGVDPAPLMSLDQVCELVEQITLNGVDGSWIPSGIHAFWDLRDSNFAGVYCSGPATGTVCFLDHEELDLAPRFRSVDRFLESICALADAEDAPHCFDRPADYPTIAPVPDDLLTFDRRLAAAFKADFDAADDSVERQNNAWRWMYVLPYQDTGILRTYLTDGDMYLQERAARLLGLRRDINSIDELERLAATFRGNGCTAAAFALGQIRSERSIAALLRVVDAAPKGWATNLGYALKDAGIRTEFDAKCVWRYLDPRTGQWRRLR